MKKTLSFLTQFGLGLTLCLGAYGQETTTVQVAPSDQIIYPDASQILNKTEPAAPAATAATASPAPATATATETPAPTTASPLASRKPLLAATPVPAQPVPAQPAPVAAPRAAAPAVHGWYLRWTVSGDEASVKAWAAALGRPVVYNPLGDVWEVWAGPFTGDGLGQAMAGQAGKAQLVRR